MSISFAEIAPYVGMVAAFLFAAWQARAKPRDLGAELGDFALRQNYVLSQQLEKRDKDYRTLDNYTQKLVNYVYVLHAIITRLDPSYAIPDMPLRSVNGDTPTSGPTLTDRNEVKWRRLLIDRLSDDEIDTLAWDLGCDSLPQGAKSERVMAILDFVRQRRKVAELLKWLHDNRADIDLKDVR